MATAAFVRVNNEDEDTKKKQSFQTVLPLMISMLYVQSHIYISKLVISKTADIPSNNAKPSAGTVMKIK